MQRGHLLPKRSKLRSERLSHFFDVMLIRLLGGSIGHVLALRFRSHQPRMPLDGPRSTRQLLRSKSSAMTPAIFFCSSSVSARRIPVAQL
jgi:hypothetical protein